jgi:hypothetical protein
MAKKNRPALPSWLIVLSALLSAGAMVVSGATSAAANTQVTTPSSSEPPCRIGEPCETAPPSPYETLDASGCTGASGGTVCGAAIGTARYAQRAYVRRTALGAMCQPSGRYYVYDSSGSLMEFNFTVRKQYPNSARTVCLGWYEEGSRIGRVCMPFPI